MVVGNSIIKAQKIHKQNIENKKGGLKWQGNSNVFKLTGQKNAIIKIVRASSYSLCVLDSDLQWSG